MTCATSVTSTLASKKLMRDSLVLPIRTMMLRELRALDREIAAYPDDESVWQIPQGISNSAGNLALHLAGNLRHFLGAVLGGSSYARDRDAEFATRGLTRAELRGIVASAIDELSDAFENITDEQLSGEYPLRVAERRLRTADFLVHLAVHLSYHLGQIDYHRRLVTSISETVDTISPKELPEIS
jgi:uncharacterized damage-inducible protein DinB